MVRRLTQPMGHDGLSSRIKRRIGNDLLEKVRTDTT
jgi:hypothetical protein